MSSYIVLILIRDLVRRLAPDRPASRAPAFFSSELLPVKVEDLVAGSPEEDRGPKQLEEVEEGDDADSESGKDDIEAEKEKKEGGSEKLGRTPRLLVIEDLEEDGSADDQELDALVLVSEDLEDEGSGDDEELGDILEEILTEVTEEEISTDEVLQSEPSSELSPENDPLEEAHEEIGDSPKEIVSPKTELGEEGEKTLSDSKDSESDSSVDVEGTKNNNSQEDITPLQGIKTILVVTTNPDKSNPEKIPEAVNSKEILNATEKNVK